MKQNNKLEDSFLETKEASELKELVAIIRRLYDILKVEEKQYDSVINNDKEDYVFKNKIKQKREELIHIQNLLTLSFYRYLEEK